MAGNTRSKLLTKLGPLVSMLIAPREPEAAVHVAQAIVEVAKWWP